MAWTVTYDLEEFRVAAGGFLRTHPARNTTLLTVVSSLTVAGSGRYGDEPPVYGWWTGEGGAVEGAFLCTPPYPRCSPPSPARRPGPSPVSSPGTAS
ncbi:hypothetical protein [Streptomyces rhizosphaericus]|uniref:hypothetical protein n=1 Tax=Streptomyces rhizosphaericus TaxID=114699 RepID=UPI003631D1D1